MKDSVKYPSIPLKKSPIFIAGLPQSGKTSFICALIHLAENNNINVAAFKPFDTGLLKRNAEERSGDGELICNNMSGEPTESLVAPYIANEDYPLEMSLRRDGVKINWDRIWERLKTLDNQYDLTLIELPPSLTTPLNEEIVACDWLTEIGNEVVWIVHPVQAQFAQNLAEIFILKQLGLQTHYVLNNASKIDDQDLLFYVWEKLESITQQTMAGLIPFDKNVDTSFISLAGKMEDSVPALVEGLLRTDGN